MVFDSEGWTAIDKLEAKMEDDYVSNIDMFIENLLASGFFENVIVKSSRVTTNTVIESNSITLINFSCKDKKDLDVNWKKVGF